MTKRKNAIALFDLINKGKAQGTSSGLNVPGWFSKRPAVDPPPGEPEQAAPAGSPPAPPPLPQATAPAPSPFSQGSPFAPSEPAEPALSFSDGRVKISLSHVACGVVGICLVGVLALAVMVGRISARANSKAIVSDLADGNAAPSRAVIRHPGDSNSPPSAPGALVKGKYYLIIDRMKGKTDEDWLDANAIVDYCQKSGFPCCVGVDGTRYAVLSLKPFDSSTSQDAQDYARAVEELGRKYRPPPGRSRYTFSQKDASGHFNPSFHKQP